MAEVSKLPEIPCSPSEETAMARIGPPCPRSCASEGLAPQRDASSTTNGKRAILTLRRIVMPLRDSLGLLVRLIAFDGKVLCVPHQLHDIDGARRTHIGIHGRRAGTDGFHAADRHCGRYKRRRENDGRLTHLVLLQ